MTIIIALKDKENKRIIIGTDKQGTGGQIIHEVPSKIVTIPLQVITNTGETKEEKIIHILISGYYSLTSFITYGFPIPVMNDEETFPEYLYQKFFPELINRLNENSLMITDAGQIDNEGELLIIYDDEIYHIDSHFGITTINEDYYIIGSSEEVALGALYTNLKYYPETDKVEMVKQAIRVAGEKTIYCDTSVDYKIINL